METYDLTTHPAASSTTPTSSADRIVRDFIAQGAPSNPTNVVEGEVLGGLQIKTPRVGTGFIEWAINGYDLEGKIKNPPEGVNYSKSGDWLYDKNVGTVDEGKDEHKYLTGIKANQVDQAQASDSTRKEK